MKTVITKIIPLLAIGSLSLPMKAKADSLNITSGTTNIPDASFDIFRDTKDYIRYFGLEGERGVSGNISLTGEFLFGWESNSLYGEKIEGGSSLKMDTDFRLYGVNLGARYRFLLKDFFRPYMRVFIGGYRAVADFTGGVTILTVEGETLDGDDEVEEVETHIKDAAWNYGIFGGGGFELLIPNRHFRAKAKAKGRDMRKGLEDFAMGILFEAGYLFTPGFEFPDFGEMEMEGLQINGGLIFHF